MGSATSKASRATGAASRQYPKTARPPTSNPPSGKPTTTTNAPPQPPPAPNHEAGPTVRPQAQATSNRSEAINLDASDPDFARSLRSLGPVQPNPTLSPSSAFQNPRDLGRAPGPNPRTNPAIAVLDARARLYDEAEREGQAYGKRGFEGRQFLDAFTIRQILIERDAGQKSAKEIERKLGLKAGVVERLGAPGVVGLVRETGRGQKGVDIV